ncbi:MAG: hypothetical protein E6J99_05185 [Methanobacteriota archaeon]|nr:MAG: hypothetical protein E6J99_05185 [Euryarchaeota archaeon]
MALPFARSRGEEKNVRAVYLFHRSGDPLVAVASDAVLPFESKHLEPLLGAVRDFVDSPEPAGHGIQQTTRRFGEEGVVGVRGQFVSACVVFHGRGDGNIRRDLVRFVREFEERNEDRLGSWEEATTLAGEASLALTSLMDGQVPSEPARFDFAVASN